MGNNSIIQIILCSIALVVSLCGAKEDIENRHFSNKKIGIIIIIGIIEAIVMKRIGTATLLFILFNVIGVVFSSLQFFSPADWKLFSAYAFFIPFEKFSISLLFIVFLFLSGILLKIHYVEKGKLKEAFLDEFNGLKVLLYTKKLMTYDENKKTYKSKTIPATVEIVSAFLFTLLFVI